MFGCVKSEVRFTKTSNAVEVNEPGISVGAEVLPVNICGPAPRVDSPARGFVVVPLKDINHPPPSVLLPNRIKTGVIATGEPSRE